MFYSTKIVKAFHIVFVNDTFIFITDENLIFAVFTTVFSFTKFTIIVANGTKTISLF